MTGGRRSLLVLRALGLGDFLTGLPALRALEAAFPAHERLLAAPEWLRPLGELTGWNLIPFSPSHPDRLPLEQVGIAVNLHGKGPMSHRVLLAIQHERLIAFANEDIPETAGFPVHRDGEHEVRRWCRLLEEFGIPADPGRLQLDVSAGDGQETAFSATLVHPGAASRARQWPPQRWGEVARARAEQGERVLLTGTAGERALCEQVRKAAGLEPRANLAGKTDLAMLVRLVRGAGLALSADTGFAHLATAVGTPSVVLFGPVSPESWGPPKDRPQHRAIWKGRHGDPHADRPDPGLMEIQVAEVLRAIDQVRTGVAAVS